MPIIIVVGEQACGKTRDAEKIANHFHAFSVLDSGNLQEDLAVAKKCVTEKLLRKPYVNFYEDNCAYGKTVVVLTNESVKMFADYRYIDSIVHYRSLNLE